MHDVCAYVCVRDDTCTRTRTRTRTRPPARGAPPRVHVPPAPTWARVAAELNTPMNLSGSNLDLTNSWGQGDDVLPIVSDRSSEGARWHGQPKMGQG